MLYLLAWPLSPWLPSILVSLFSSWPHPPPHFLSSLLTRDTLRIPPTLQTMVSSGDSPSGISPEVIQVDLDAMQVKPCGQPQSTLFPTSINALASSCPPVSALIRRLQTVSSADNFDEVAVQAACVQFVADVLNPSNGFLSDSNAPHDNAALATWSKLLEFGEDLRLRCERDSEVARHAPLLKPKLADSLAASLSSVCEGSGVAYSRGGKPVGPFLSLVYASRAFRQWWVTHEGTESQEQKLCRMHRTYQLNIADHLGDHR